MVYSCTPCNYLLKITTYASEAHRVQLITVGVEEAATTRDGSVIGWRTGIRLGHHLGQHNPDICRGSCNSGGTPRGRQRACWNHRHSAQNSRNTGIKQVGFWSLEIKWGNDLFSHQSPSHPRLSQLEYCQLEKSWLWSQQTTCGLISSWLLKAQMKTLAHGTDVFNNLKDNMHRYVSD